MRWRPFLLLLALASATALATTLVPHTLAQRALAADRVVIVEVQERESATDPKDPRVIFTRTLLRVVENVRGAGPSTIPLVQLGGQVGTKVASIPGDAAFTPGERALVFVNCPAADRCHLVAFGEGKLPIVDGEYVIVHDLFTHERTRRPLAAVKEELRKLPPGKVKPGGAK